MKTTTGIFSSRAEAERVLQQLHETGFTDTQVSMLSPGETNGEKNSVTTTDGEQPGMGKVIGGVVGAAVGASGGLPLGMALSSVIFPGLGPVMAIGFLGAALVGAAGAAGGAAAGGALENTLTEGLPHDELYFYEDALRHGKTVLIFRTDDDAQLERVKKIMSEDGAESIDAAREQWWIGLRDSEAEHYEPSQDFSSVEANYRKGFEAALDRRNQGKNFDQALPNLAARFPVICYTKEFRAGYERGQKHGPEERSATILI